MQNDSYDKKQDTRQNLGLTYLIDIHMYLKTILLGAFCSVQPSHSDTLFTPYKA